VVRFRMKGERVLVTSAKIGAEKRSHPGATAIGNGNDDRVAARKLACATAEITARPSRGQTPKSKSRNGFLRRKLWKSPWRAVLVRCYFDGHSDRWITCGTVASEGKTG